MYKNLETHNWEDAMDYVSNKNSLRLKARRWVCVFFLLLIFTELKKSAQKK